MLTGFQVNKLHEITADVLVASFGELPPETIHGAHLAADAAAALLAKLKTLSQPAN